MKKKLQVFISSTYRDLLDERQAAVEAILKAGHIPAGMELFTAGDISQMDTIKKWIDESDIFMIILGGRYGSIEPTTSLSYIELEYDYALDANKPLFAIVITEDAIDRKAKEMGISALETDNPNKLKEFREKVLTKMSAFFDDSRDIKLRIFESLNDLKERYDLHGWVRGNYAKTTEELEKTNQMYGHINKLESELEKLKKVNRKDISKFAQDSDEIPHTWFNRSLSHNVTWDDIFKVVASYCIGANKNEADIKSLINSFFIDELKLIFEQDLNIKFSEIFEQIKIQFIALKLIEIVTIVLGPYK